MATKRALVVDDSKTARIALRRLLEKHAIEVDQAECAEDALEYLRDQRPHVIFMDHMMPGMDGLEAVKIIKERSETATIPVMMYTTKGGEMYCSQARALGALGVLPKEVKPVDVDNILHRLGLRADQRSEDAPVVPAEWGRTARTSAAIEYSPLIEAMRDASHAAETNSLDEIKQLLVAQRSHIKQDLARNNQALARDVAQEFHERSLLEAVPGSDGEGFRAGRSAGVLALVAVMMMLVFPAGWLYSRYSEVAADNQRLSAENSRLAQSVKTTEPSKLTGSPLLAAIAPVAESDSATLGTPSDSRILETIEWALGKADVFDFGEKPMNDRTLNMLGELLPRLAAVGFKGEVRLEAHIGRFCVSADQANGTELPEAQTPIADCRVQSFTTEEAAQLGKQQSIAFANFLSSLRSSVSNGIHVDVASVGTGDPVTPYPPINAVQTAGEWNRIAQANNRVEFSLVPAIRSAGL